MLTLWIESCPVQTSVIHHLHFFKMKIMTIILLKQFSTLYEVAPRLLRGRTPLHSCLLGFNKEPGNQPNSFPKPLGTWRDLEWEQSQNLPSHLWEWSRQHGLPSDGSVGDTRASWLLGETVQTSEWSKGKWVWLACFIWFLRFFPFKAEHHTLLQYLSHWLLVGKPCGTFSECAHFYFCTVLYNC